MTGSNIRRVDIETANPVITIDRAQIQKSGKLTVGDLVQELPSIAGQATNPQVNNGGGTGALVDLAARSWRQPHPDPDRRPAHHHTTTSTRFRPTWSSASKSCSTALRRPTAPTRSPALSTSSCARTTRAPSSPPTTAFPIVTTASARAAQFTFGQSTDRGSVVAGINYNKYDAVSAGKREFSRNALYLYGGVVYRRWFEPRADRSHLPAGRPLRWRQFGLLAATASPASRAPPARRSTTIVASHNSDIRTARRFLQLPAAERDPGSAGAHQPVRIGQLQADRQRRSLPQDLRQPHVVGSLIAPYPFDALQQRRRSFPRDNIYNPFGIRTSVSIRRVRSNPNCFERLTGVGQRISQFDTADLAVHRRPARQLR